MVFFQSVMRIATVLFILSLGACQSDIPEEIAEVDLPDQVDFNFHIRPILADRCYHCHGPDDETRAADLRLDLEESAFEVLPESGGHAIVRGNLEKSEVWHRIISEDPELIMPPPESKLSLSNLEKALIARWIEDGAEWKKHWAFIPPRRTELPQEFPAEWVTQNSIDRFVYARMEEQGLAPTAIASKERLIRRLSFDLRGLPPSFEEVDAFLRDESEDAYATLVDRFMQGDAYAERMTMEWLDVARFADSHGLHADGVRDMSPWRDWVIKAFKNNYSYDQFVTWQLAGDLLPESTTEQKLATGFHRNHSFSTELGVVSEEYRLGYVADRTNTTATAFLGLTMECAACHDHKFDPISQKEYYAMSAFFNNIPELGMTGTDKNFGPMILLPDEETEKKIAQLSNQVGALEEQAMMRAEEIDLVKNYIRPRAPKPKHFFPLDHVANPKTDKISEKLVIDGKSAAVVYGGHEEGKGQVGDAVRIAHDFDGMQFSGVKNFEIYEPFSVGCWIKTEKKGKYQTIVGNIGEKNTSWRGWVVYLDSLNHLRFRMAHALPHNLIELVVEEVVPTDEWHHVFLTYDGSAKASGADLYLDGKKLDAAVVADNLYKTIIPTRNRDYTLWPEKPLALGAGVKYLYTDVDDGIYEGFFDQLRVYYRDLSAIEVSLLHDIDLGKEPSIDFARNEKEEYYLKTADVVYGKLQEDLARLRKEKLSIVDPIKESMVLQEMDEPRATFVLDRGQYDAPAERVFASTPKSIGPLPDYLPPDRLGLAHWLFEKDNPLTARVAVNRYWQMIFGTGIVSTPHDFGMQGALPTHPDLLDWLAVEFVESGWDLKHLLKLMVMSQAYRRSSEASEDTKEQDPANIYLARGASYRMAGEMIRDNSLWASGLLNDTVGGPSVKPYQPEGLWKEKNEFSGYLNDYVADTGQNLYRRSMYTFIRRTSPPPAMTTFDQPNRSICIVKRETTSSPLQSLVLMNDPQFVEASRILSERMQKEGGENLAGQIEFGFRLACGRQPRAEEMALLQDQYLRSKEKYRQDEKSAHDLLQIGTSPVDQSLPIVETAALSMVANTMINFDEAYMKR